MCYDGEELNRLKHIPNNVLFNRTMERENYIKSKGYNLITIWEHEWRQIEKTLKNH